MHAIKDIIIDKAKKLGFALCGVTDASEVPGLGHLENAIEEGRIGKMKWLARAPALRADPKSLLPGARSVICCALPYWENGIDGDGKNTRTARFKRGKDYHAVVRSKLNALWEEIKKIAPYAAAKICCDSNPILEKALAERAGIGWIGKHTILVNERIGSWFVLGEIITDMAIEPGKPAKNLCGNCAACINACPTSAILSPNKLAANRCVSYQRPEIGCDICQEICPFNRLK